MRQEPHLSALTIPGSERNRPLACSFHRGGTVEQCNDRFILDRPKIIITFPNGSEISRHMQTDNLVRLETQLIKRIWRSDWHRENELVRGAAPHGPQGSPHGGTRRDSVIDDQSRAVLDIDWPARFEIKTAAAFDLTQLMGKLPVEIGSPNTEFMESFRVDDFLRHRAVGNRADRKLGLRRMPDLADKYDIKRRAEPCCDLEAHRHAAARQGEYDRMSSLESQEFRCEPPASVPAIQEPHGFAPP